MKCTTGDSSLERGHDWVLVPQEHVVGLAISGTRQGKLLWACPCGEFRWTSYAEWEKAEKGLPTPA